jgi:hypothetical protein
MTVGRKGVGRRNSSLMEPFPFEHELVAAAKSAGLSPTALSVKSYDESTGQRRAAKASTSEASVRWLRFLLKRSVVGFHDRPLPFFA